MLFHALAASTILMLSFTAVTATPFDGIDATQSQLVTATYCANITQGVPGTYSSLGSGLFCGCSDYNVGATVDACPGGTTAACSATQVLSGGVWTYEAACTVCSHADSCVADGQDYVSAVTQYDSSCPTGEVLFLNGGKSCGCATRAKIASLPASHTAEICDDLTTTGSYAYCQSSVTSSGGSAPGVVASCSLGCLPGYQSFELGPGFYKCILGCLPGYQNFEYGPGFYKCILSPTASPLSKRRKMDEINKRRQLESVF